MAQMRASDTHLSPLFEEAFIDRPLKQSRGEGNNGGRDTWRTATTGRYACYRSGAVAHSVVLHAVADLENEKMKAIRVHEFGGPEVLKLEDVPTPKTFSGPGAGAHPCGRGQSL